ncbi:MAG: DUF2892 domain-containing protein [Anaerolineae bacterium]|nr:DUF2892 domain-containing protein [Anaerolineae bacterium]
MNVALEQTTLRNEGSLDRAIRLILAVVFFQLAFFWLGGIGQIVFYALAAVLLITAIAGFCPLYKILGISTLRAGAKPLGKISLTVAGLIVVVILIAGSYASDFFSRKFFLDDFNRMNNYYKQTLFTTGQQDREKAVENYERLIAEYAAFQVKYSSYHPYALKGDAQFNSDLQQVQAVISGVADQVHSGDLSQAHVALEQVRPVFQDIFKRNNFSLLAVALVDFHDAMELILDPANAKEAEQVVTLYPEVSAKLQVVEAEANDAEIQTIRQNLDTLLKLAQNGMSDELPAKAGELKSSFVKVYLTRG